MLADVPNHINQNNKNKWQIHKLENVAGHNEFMSSILCGLGMD